MRRAYFYIFSSKNIPPKKLTKEEYTHLYFNFHILRSDHNAPNSSHNKRKALSDITDDLNNSITTVNIISPEQKQEEKNQIKIQIGNYFTSIQTKKLFGCKNEEEVYNCLSHRIDMFDDILNNNLPIWKIINKGDNKSELTPSEVISIMQKIVFLRQAYLNVLNLDQSDKIHFKQCCKKAVQKCQKMGLNAIISPYNLMRLNRYFCKEETFPNPNITIE